jgi:hypothetical protein
MGKEIDKGPKLFIMETSINGNGRMVNLGILQKLSSVIEYSSGKREHNLNMNLEIVNENASTCQHWD